jgi:hypothetical protein
MWPGAAAVSYPLAFHARQGSAGPDLLCGSRQNHGMVKLVTEQFFFF